MVDAGAQPRGPSRSARTGSLNVTGLLVKEHYSAMSASTLNFAMSETDDGLADAEQDPLDVVSNESRAKVMAAEYSNAVLAEDEAHEKKGQFSQRRNSGFFEDVFDSVRLRRLFGGKTIGCPWTMNSIFVV